MATKLTISQRLAVYLHFRDSLLHIKETEDRQSEQRIAFFFTLAALVLALITYSGRDQTPNTLGLTLAISIFALFLFGLLTLARVVWRSRNVDGLEHTIENICKAIEALDPQVKETLKPRDENRVNSLLKPWQGTLAQFMYLSEFLLFGGFVYLVGGFLGCQTPCSLLLAFCMATALVFGLFKWSQHVRGRSGNS
jgi:hypothetical protein